MPFESEAQRRYLWANHPEVAELFAKHTPKGTKLPARTSHPQLLADLPPKTAALSPLRLGNQPIVIDRPAGFRKTFPTPAGPMEREYPVDYGYFHGITNPDDGEDADVFFGQGGSNYGRFMKGKNLSGQWEPDERKWYAGLTDEQLAAVKDLFESQSQGLLQDFVTFPDHTQLLADLPSKTAALSPLLTKVISQYASLTPVHRAMQTPTPAITQPMLVKALQPGNIPPTPGLQASQIGGTAKTANTHLSERAQLAPSTFEILAEAFQARHAQNLKEAALKPPMPKMPTSITPQFLPKTPQAPPAGITQIPTILGVPPQQPAQTGSQKPHNAKSVYGAGPLSNTGIAGVGVNLNPVTAGLAMRKGANWDEKLARLIARRGEADPLRPWLLGQTKTRPPEPGTPTHLPTGAHGTHTRDSYAGEKAASIDNTVRGGFIGAGLGMLGGDLAGTAYNAVRTPTEDPKQAEADKIRRQNIGALLGMLAGGGLGALGGHHLPGPVAPPEVPQTTRRPADITNIPLDTLKQAVQQRGGLYMPDKPYAAPLTISTP